MTWGLSTRAVSAPSAAGLRNRWAKPVKYLPLSQFFLQQGEVDDSDALTGFVEPEGKKGIKGRPKGQTLPQDQAQAQEEPSEGAEAGEDEAARKPNPYTKHPNKANAKPGEEDENEAEDEGDEEGAKDEPEKPKKPEDIDKLIAKARETLIKTRPEGAAMPGEGGGEEGGEESPPPEEEEEPEPEPEPKEKDDGEEAGAPDDGEGKPPEGKEKKPPTPKTAKPQKEPEEDEEPEPEEKVPPKPKPKQVVLKPGKPAPKKYAAKEGIGVFAPPLIRARLMERKPETCIFCKEPATKMFLAQPAGWPICDKHLQRAKARAKVMNLGPPQTAKPIGERHPGSGSDPIPEGMTTTANIATVPVPLGATPEDDDKKKRKRKRKGQSLSKGLTMMLRRPWP